LQAIRCGSHPTDSRDKNKPFCCQKAAGGFSSAQEGVPLFVVNEAVDRIKDGTITGYVYDPKAAALVRVGRT
jgi:hypothetical protein